MQMVMIMTIKLLYSTHIIIKYYETYFKIYSKLDILQDNNNRKYVDLVWNLDYKHQLLLLSADVGSPEIL